MFFFIFFSLEDIGERKVLNGTSLKLEKMNRGVPNNQSLIKSANSNKLIFSLETKIIHQKKSQEKSFQMVIILKWRKYEVGFIVSHELKQNVQKVLVHLIHGWLWTARLNYPTIILVQFQSSFPLLSLREQKYWRNKMSLIKKNFLLIISSSQTALPILEKCAAHFSKH